MQINKVESSQSYNPKFGMAIKATSRAKDYIKKNFSQKAIKELDRLIQQEEKNVLNVKLSVDTYNPLVDTNPFELFIGRKPWFQTEYLRIEAGDKTFSDLSNFSSAIGQIKKAVNYLPKYDKKLQDTKEINNVINKL